jgi:hypothetical protein
LRALRNAGSCAAALCLLLGAAGCATYSDYLKSAHQRVAQGDYAGGIEELDDFLGVDQRNELPAQLGSNGALGVLERGTLLQATGDWELSARDMGAADEALLVLDIADDTGGSIARYLYSESATKYRASPTEKLALNGFNMLNYLARGDLAGARVETRRFTAARDYLRNFDPGQPHGSFGSYLAGFVFEKLGEPDSALRYYEEALEARSFPTLRGPLARLVPRSSFRGDRIAELLGRGEAPPPTPDDAAEILTVVSVGRSPIRVPERMPVGAALGIAGAYVTGNPRVLAYTALKVVVYPALQPVASLYGRAAVSIDGRQAPVDLASNLSAEVRREYERIKPRILGAALSRLIVRAVAAEGARAAGKEAGGSAVGLLLSLFTEGALVALDKPDTRSWTFLPGEVYVSRQTVAPGHHEVVVQLSGAGHEERRLPVDLPPRGFAVLVVTAPR